MAGLEIDSQLTGTRLARQQYSSVALLRWQIFKNSMRRKNAVGELMVRILSYPFVAMMVLGPAAISGFAGWYFISHEMDSYLAIPLWIVFALWQFIGVSTSTTGPSFDLSTLTRFPLRYRDYLVIRLSFGLLDIPTLAGTACLLAMCIGIGIAAPSLFPSAVLTLFVYAIANILFSRMVYSWFERLLARRRTRELLTGLILVFSLAIQFGSQFLQKMGTTHGHHRVSSPLVSKTTQLLIQLSNLLPPGLTASSIANQHKQCALLAAGDLGALLLYTAVFLAVLHVRLHAQYLGENLSEAPSNSIVKTPKPSNTMAYPANSSSQSNLDFGRSLLPPTVSACFTRELHYLLRSGPKLYALVMPVFMLLLFSFRTAGLQHAGVTHWESATFLFPYGCAYMQLILVAMLYNSLGSDSSGVQFYFIAPVRFQDVMLAKNLLTATILIIELVLIYTVSSLVASPAPPAMVAATLAWTLFTFLLNMSIGNIRSIVSPKVVEAGRVRRQNVSGMSSLISLSVVLLTVGMGAAAQFLCTLFDLNYWWAAMGFSALAVAAFAAYLTVLRGLDKTAFLHREELILELSRA